ncbi:MAG: hypothetical protein GXY34_06230 [Syntrophomonadaceae bacterium]|nr:hypothetical protein [Syntrophomonadaceae bacterium]
MNNKAWLYTDGNSAWKYNTHFENWLSYRADQSDFFKRLYVKYYRMLDRTYYWKGLQLINKEIDNFLTRGGVLPASREYIIIDMIYSLHRFGAMFGEYFLYEFYNKNTAGREEYICDKYRYDYYRMMNIDQNREIFDNKDRTYEHFKAFYGRDFLAVRSEEQKEEFVAFINRHNIVMIKPLASSGGRGVQKRCISEEDSVPFFEKTLKEGPFVVEEVIIQAPEMAQFHPSSINTLRVPTVIANGKVELFAPVIRIGRGNAVVDNGFAGGIVANIDVETGIVCSAGCNEKGERFIVHPDTKIPIIGFKIPEWESVVDLVKKLANVVSGNRYTGWDLAFTPNGYIMVEGNARGEFVILQMPNREGLKKKLCKLI